MSPDEFMIGKIISVKIVDIDGRETELNASDMNDNTLSASEQEFSSYKNAIDRIINGNTTAKMRHITNPTI